MQGYMKEIRKKERCTIEKLVKVLNKHFSKDEIQLANKHQKESSSGKCKFETVKYCYLYPKTEWLKWKRLMIPSKCG